MPDGSRQRTSDRSDSAMRSVGRSRMDGASTGTLSSAHAAVDQHGALLELTQGDGQVEGDGRLADPALRGEHRDDPGRPARGRLGMGAADAGHPVHQFEAGERHREHGVDAARRIDRDRVLGHGQHDDRDVQAGGVDLLDELGTLDPTL